MRALDLVGEWPVTHAAVAVLLPDGSVVVRGDRQRRFPLASVSKVLFGWTALIAAEEGTIAIDAPVADDGCTIRHLLAHAGGYPAEGRHPVAPPGSRRIYSNGGIEVAAQLLEGAAQMPYGDYFDAAVLEPLHLTGTTLEGSPAHGVTSTIDDLVRFVGEVRAPRLVSNESARQFATPQFPGLAGLVPGVGRFDDCAWGLTPEIRALKQPHWTGSANSPSTFGHFGASGTFVWIDPDAQVACIVLTDRPFEQWSAEALRRWPQLSDAVLAEVA